MSVLEMTCGHRVDGVWEGRGAPADAIAASQKGRTPRTNAVGHHPEVVRGVRVDAVAADLQHDLRLELIFSVGIEVVLERLQEARVRVLEGQDLCGNQPVCRVLERRGTGIATPSSRCRVDGVKDDAMIQHERAVKF